MLHLLNHHHHHYHHHQICIVFGVIVRLWLLPLFFLLGQKNFLLTLVRPDNRS